jgi:Lipocalin-like domain
VTADALVGSWKLLHIGVETADTGQRMDLYGPNPVGRAILTDSGHVMFIITAGGRPVPRTESDRAGLFESMMAYTGTYRVEGDDKIIASVDASWHPSWLASEQVWFFKLNGDVLSIRSGLQTHSEFPREGATASSNGSVRGEPSRTVAFVVMFLHPLEQSPRTGWRLAPSLRFTSGSCRPSRTRR